MTQRKLPLLNLCVTLPIFGRLGGLVRMVGAIVHTLFHLIAIIVTLFQLKFQDAKTHSFHALKGTTEFLRGIIEIIPIIAFWFSLAQNKIFKMDPNKPYSAPPVHSYFILGVESKIRTKLMHHEARVQKVRTSNGG